MPKDEIKPYDFYCPAITDGCSTKLNTYKHLCEQRQRLAQRDSICYGGCAYIKWLDGRGKKPPEVKILRKRSHRRPRPPEFYQTLKRLSENKNLSQVRIAEIMRVSTTTVRKQLMKLEEDPSLLGKKVDN